MMGGKSVPVSALGRWPCHCQPERDAPAAISAMQGWHGSLCQEIRKVQGCLLPSGGREFCSCHKRVRVVHGATSAELGLVAEEGIPVGTAKCLSVNKAGCPFDLQGVAQNTFSHTLFWLFGPVTVQPQPLGVTEAVPVWDHTRRVVCAVPWTWAGTLQVTAPFCKAGSLETVGCFQLYKLPFTNWVPRWNADKQT